MHTPGSTEPADTSTLSSRWFTHHGVRTPHSEECQEEGLSLFDVIQSKKCGESVSCDEDESSQMDCKSGCANINWLKQHLFKITKAIVQQEPCQDIHE